MESSKVLHIQTRGLVRWTHGLFLQNVEGGVSLGCSQCLKGREETLQIKLPPKKAWDSKAFGSPDPLMLKPCKVTSNDLLIGWKRFQFRCTSSF